MPFEKKRPSYERGGSVHGSVVNKKDDLDDVLDEIGGCSHYQLRRHVLFFLLSIPFACQSLVMVFVGHDPGTCVQKNITHCIAIGKFSSVDTCPKSGQHYFLKKAKFSIVTEFDLVCDRGYLEQMANSSFFVGAIFGSIILGWIADRFGRKPVLFCCLAIVMLISGMTAISKTLWFFIMARFLIGFFMSGVALALYVIALEIVSPSHQSVSATFLLNYFSAGLMILGLKAYLLQNWRYLQLATTLPYMLLFLCYKIFPESLRWLWSTGQYKRANATIQRIADENKKADCLSHFSSVISVEGEDNELTNYLHLFKNKRLLFHTTILTYTSLVVGTTYYGFFLISNYLTGDVYLDFILIAMMEIPANFLSTFSTGRFGRRKTVVLSLLMASLSSLSLFFTTKRTRSDLTLGFALFGKLFLSTGLVSSNIWSCEICPTVSRNKGLGMVTVIRLLGGAAAPWLTTFLSHSDPASPFLIMGVAVGIAGLLCVLLPETRDVPSKDTFDDLKSNNNEDELNRTDMTELNFDYVQLTTLDRETVV